MERSERRHWLLDRLLVCDGEGVFTLSPTVFQKPPACQASPHRWPDQPGTPDVGWRRRQAEAVSIHEGPAPLIPQHHVAFSETAHSDDSLTEVACPDSVSSLDALRECLEELLTDESWRMELKFAQSATARATVHRATAVNNAMSASRGTEAGVVGPAADSTEALAVALAEPSIFERSPVTGSTTERFFKTLKTTFVAQTSQILKNYVPFFLK